MPSKGDLAPLSNTGKCELCGHGAAELKFGGHLAKCAPEHDPTGPAELVLQLRFESAEDPRYWIHVEARANTTFRQVDSLLRRVWLECCGHMSAFRVGREEVGMGSSVGEVFHRKRLKFEYEYDFGTTTALKGRVIGGREGSLGRSAVRLLARNDPLRWPCAECAAPATLVCAFCIYEGGCFFCKTHASRHSHAREEGFLPVVNSPRMGMCGYTG